jgi:hypothetical protein
MSSSVEMKWRSAPSLRHRGAGGGQLVGARGRRVRRSCSYTGSAAGRTVAPDLVEQVEIGAQLDAARGQGVASRRATARPSTRASTATVWPAAMLAASQSMCSRLAPDGIFISGFRCRPVPARPGVVAAVGPDAGEIGGGDEGADRAGEAGQPFAALPAAGQVFGQVRVGRRC